MTRRPIVCAVDDSDVAGVTLARAAALASWHEAELDVVHVLPQRGAPMVRGPLNADEVDSRTRGWLAEQIAGRVTTPVVRPVFYRGDPAAAIVHHAQAREARMVVVGTRGFRRLRRYRASVARTVARTAECPVLIAMADPDAPQTSPPAHFAEIVCAVDFSPASLAALERALQLAQESGGRLHVVHVMDGVPTDFPVAGARAAQFARAFEVLKAEAGERVRAAIPADALDWCETAVRIVGGMPAREIASVADEVHADLIVIGTQSRGLVRRALGSTTLAGLLRDANCPVLAVPATAGHADWPVPDGAFTEAAESFSSIAGRTAPGGGLPDWCARRRPARHAAACR
jgi:nucleotide-binding universal stress UspA family protein